MGGIKVGWTKGPYEKRNTFKILVVGKLFGKQSFGRRGGDGRLLRNTDLRVVVWWKCSVDPSMRADYCGIRPEFQSISL
jgi:hypothetical protein